MPDVELTNDSVRALIREMVKYGAHVARVTPRRADGSPIFTLLLVDAPDAEQMRILDAAQESL